MIEKITVVSVIAAKLRAIINLIKLDYLTFLLNIIVL
ncbi:MAG: hypothetical protein ACI9VT_003486 [Psychroserpens sp.]|jgi:hypothetical protein